MRVICVNAKDVQLTQRDTYTVIKEYEKYYRIMNDVGKVKHYTKARFTEEMK